MKYQSFVADNFDEAKKKVVREFGTDAIVIKKNNIVKSRLFGLLKKRLVEIVAGRRGEGYQGRPVSRETKGIG